MPDVAARSQRTTQNGDVGRPLEARSRRRRRVIAPYQSQTVETYWCSRGDNQGIETGMLWQTHGTQKPIDRITQGKERCPYLQRLKFSSPALAMSYL